MIYRFYTGLILICCLLGAIAAHTAGSNGLLKPPGLRPHSAPAIVIPAGHHYSNLRLELPLYKSASGTPLEGWSREFIRTRRFSSDQSAWIYYRRSDLKRSRVITNTGMPDSLRIWPVGATLILEGYKGDALRSANARLLEIEVMTKSATGPESVAKAYFPVDWSYARFTPDGARALSGDKLLECHQCHSIAFRLTGDLIFTQFP